MINECTFKTSCKPVLHSVISLILAHLQYLLTLQTAVRADSNTGRVRFLLTADSALMLILSILKQEVRNERKWHVLPSFFSRPSPETFSDGENRAYITNNNTHTCVSGFQGADGGVRECSGRGEEKPSRNHHSTRPGPGIKHTRPAAAHVHKVSFKPNIQWIDREWRLGRCVELRRWVFNFRNVTFKICYRRFKGEKSGFLINSSKSLISLYMEGFKATVLASDDQDLFLSNAYIS